MKPVTKERLELLAGHWGLMAEDDGRGNHVPPKNPLDIIAAVINDLALMSHEFGCNMDDGHGYLDNPLFPVLSVDRLDPFTRAYMECALFAENDESDPETGGEPVDRNYDISDYSTEAICDMMADCEQFQVENKADLEAAYADETMDKSPADAGYDFWFTRRGHGVGFWEKGDWPEEIGERLTAAAKKFGNIHLYIEDGVIYTERG